MIRVEDKTFSIKPGGFTGVHLSNIYSNFAPVLTGKQTISATTFSYGLQSRSKKTFAALYDEYASTMPGIFVSIVKEQPVAETILRKRQVLQIQTAKFAVYTVEKDALSDEAYKKLFQPAPCVQRCTATGLIFCYTRQKASAMLSLPLSTVKATTRAIPLLKSDIAMNKVQL